MNAVRRLFDDLVQKKLWPAALLLVVTAIAVPLVIGGGGDGGSPAVPDPASALPSGAASATPAVELVGPPAVRSRGGSVRDPFRRAKVKAAADTSPGAVAASDASAKKSSATKSSATKSSATKSGSSAGATSGAKKTAGAKSGSNKAAKKTPKATPKATPAIDPSTISLARSSYQTTVRFTRPGGTRERPLARLAVLGNPDAPALQYLGVGSGRKNAIFVLGPDATATGDSACVVADPCRAIMLGRGKKLGVDVVGKDLVTRHYEVEVVGLRRLSLASVASARSWRARVDPAGGAVLHTLERDPVTASVLDRLRYTTRTGTVSLTRAP